VPLSDVDKALRLSMSLRGLRPAAEELHAVEADPRALDDLLDAWLDSLEFGLTMRDLHAEQLLVRTDVIEQLPRRGPLELDTTHVIHRDTSEAPLRLIEWVITQDLPYTEIVTTDVMLKSEIMSKVYGLSFDPDGEAWQLGQWEDGRPLAGILSSSEIWRRYRSAGQNNNRSRADFIGTALLCEPFSTRDIPTPTGIDLSDEEAVADAVNLNQACVGCHQSLDPLAAFLWGFQKQIKGRAVRNAYDDDCYWPLDDAEALPQDGIVEDMCYPVRSYIPEREDDWMPIGLRPPGYFGMPGDRIDDLGQYIAADPRFASCTARRFWSWFAQEPVEQVDDALVEELTSVFVAANFDAKALTRAVVTHPRFLSRAPEDATGELPLGVLTARPEQLQRSVADLTGFRWWADPDPEEDDCEDECWGRVDLTLSDRYGFRAMAGGVDGNNVTRPTHMPTPTAHLFRSRFSAEAAAVVVAHDSEALPEERRLLTHPKATEVEEVREQLALLHLQISSEIVAQDSAVVDASLDLWQAAYDQSGDSDRAWGMVITALFQDARMVFY
jgi:hypothetical protein